MHANWCHGACEEHKGEVKSYRVVDPKDGFDWGIYLYCEEAVKEDIQHGFELTLTEEN